MGRIVSPGICHLCGQQKTLVDSHVWSKFAYKRYVSDLNKGGQFIDLFKKNSKAYRHYTRPWFCEQCDNEILGLSEKYAAEFCQRLEHAPKNVHSYDSSLLIFTVSISWRTVKSWQEKCDRIDNDAVRKACKRWKDFLRGRKRDVRPYSQHLFIVFDQESSLHKGIGGQVFTTERLVFSQVGPLFIIGLLDRSHLSVEDLKVWSHSELSVHGGIIKPISEWRIGSEITLDCARLLRQHDVRIKQQLVKLWNKPGNRHDCGLSNLAPRP